MNAIEYMHPWLLKLRLHKENRCILPPLVCRDHYAISIQADTAHFCTPRVDDAPDYTHYECKPWSNKYPRSWQHLYDPCISAAAQVPVGMLVNLLLHHGGIQRVMTWKEYEEAYLQWPRSILFTRGDMIKINREWRAEQAKQNHLWPICNKFDLAESCIKMAREMRYENEECFDGKAYRDLLDWCAELIVNNDKELRKRGA
jgi:hypothetical protein